MSTQKALVVEKVGDPFEFVDIPIPTLVKYTTQNPTPHPTSPQPAPPHLTHPPHPHPPPPLPFHPPPPTLLSPHPPPLPAYSPHDVLIRVLAVALNPVDMKLRAGSKGGLRKGDAFSPPKILGFDGAGIIHQAHPSCPFRVGDEVYWAGDMTRAGSFQQHQLVDSRLIARKPRSLTFPQAASLPLCTITAYEALKERMHVQPGHSILITAGAGGVGSIATQLAHLWGLTVIASTSRPDTTAWTLAHGADITVDHRKGIALCFEEQRLGPVRYALNTYSERMLTDVLSVLAPLGHVTGINSDLSTEEVPALASMQRKSQSYSLEFMFAKAMYHVEEQSVGDLLAEVAALVDEGKLVHTVGREYSWHEVQQAFEYLEGRTVIGKIVMRIDENQSAVKQP